MFQRDRCGAEGIIRSLDGKPVLVVEKIIEDILHDGRKFKIPADDIQIGTVITMETLSREQRGIVILTGTGEYMDEGEVNPRMMETEKFYVFTSDHDESGLSGREMSQFVATRVRLKWELYDLVGAVKRLREIKNSFHR